MTVAALKQLVLEDFEAVNQLMREHLQSEIPLIGDITHHILQGGGKRLRPLLVLLSSKACNYHGLDHRLLAVVVEFFHTATLLHDDVVDESSLRRGRETAHEIWGSKASILVGDYLFTQSFQLLVKINHASILKLFAETSHKMSCGEVKQLLNRNNYALSLEDYFDIIGAKTALLFAASAAIGAHLSNASQEYCDKLYQFGYHLGCAFQIMDDILDYSSDTASFGKPLGIDFSEGKMTLPLIYALKAANPSQEQAIKTALQDPTKASFEIVLSLIHETKALDLTYQRASSEAEKALDALQCLDESSYKEALKQLVDFALQRAY